MENRVFGCAVIRVQNASYNADFTGTPRTLPDGVAYATDKALKYTVRNYIVDNSSERVLYYTKYNESNNPMSLDEVYKSEFGDFPKDKKNGGKQVLKNLLNAVDIRMFGATFAVKDFNFSLHGNIQISHGVNRFTGEQNIFTEDIVSPFRNSAKKDANQTTIGNQTKLEEGHFVHNFSINPKNLKEMVEYSEGGKNISRDDYQLFKDALNRGATYLDSTSMAGVENELSIFVELKKESKIVLPSFVNLITIEQSGDKRVANLDKVRELIEKVQNHIESVEIYYNNFTLEKIEIEGVKLFSIIDGEPL